MRIKSVYKKEIYCYYPYSTRRPFLTFDKSYFLSLETWVPTKYILKMDTVLISATIHRTNTNNSKLLVNEREIKPFHTTGLLLYPPENIRKPLVSWYSQGVEKVNSGMKWVKVYSKRHKEITLLTFTCSKSTIKTLEKDVKYVES